MGSFRDWRDFHETMAYGIEQGKILAIKRDGAVRMFTPAHLEDGTLEPSAIEDAITAEEYMQLAELDMAAGSN